jgi:glucokinase
VLNDFHAVACALPELTPDDLVEIGNGKQQIDGNRAVLGPGSGLGMAAWIGSKDDGNAMCGEGGHITLAARNAAEESLIRKIRDRFGHSSAERVLSGPGIVNLHWAMHGQEAVSSEQISASVDDPRCAATMDQFFAFLGSVAADLALICGAFGGIYVGGGILPACIDQFRASPFRERFEDKNRYRDYMRAIPTYVITDPTPGLTGVIAYITRHCQ